MQGCTEIIIYELIRKFMLLFKFVLHSHAFVINILVVVISTSALRRSVISAFIIAAGYFDTISNKKNNNKIQIPKYPVSKYTAPKRTT